MLGRGSARRALTGWWTSYVVSAYWLWSGGGGGEPSTAQRARGGVSFSPTFRRGVRRTEHGKNPGRDNLRIALVGGTGPFGVGLAVRWADLHEILIGSRNRERATSACKRIGEMLPDRRAMDNLQARENYHAIEESEVVVPCIAYEYAIPTLRELIGGFDDQIVISPLTPMMGSEGSYQYLRPQEGSAAQQLAAILPKRVQVASCFQGLPASKLLNTRRSLNFDVPVFADSGSARKQTFDLIRDIKHLKPLHGGPLESAYLGEMMGVLWSNLAALNKLRDPSYTFLE